MGIIVLIARAVLSVLAAFSFAQQNRGLPAGQDLPGPIPILVPIAPAQAYETFALPNAELSLRLPPELAPPEFEAQSHEAPETQIGAAVAPFDVLSRERVEFSKEQVEDIARLETGLVSAVKDAALFFDRGEQSAVFSRGSTSRGTYTSDKPDFDINVRLPKSWTEERFERFLSEDLQNFTVKLRETIRARLEPVMGGLSADVELDSPIKLSDTGSNQPFPGTRMIPVRVLNAARGVVADVDVTLTINDAVANPYPEYFQFQLEQVRRLWGGLEAERLLSDIRLAKKYFKLTLRAYTPWRGGPSAVGIEQMIMQSGSVKEGGRTIVTPGSFDLFMRKISEIAFDEDGRPRRKPEAAALWTVHNPFMQPANFLDLIGSAPWERLAAASRVYLDAQRRRKSLVLYDLTQQKARLQAAAGAGAHLRPALPPVDLRGWPVAQVAVESPLNLKDFSKKLDFLAGRLWSHYAASLKILPAKAHGDARVYIVSAELQRGASPAPALAALLDMPANVGRVIEGSAKERAPPPSEHERFNVVLAVERGWAGDGSRNGGKGIGRLIHFFARQQGVREARRVGPDRRQPNEPGLIGLVLEEGADALAFVEQAAGLLAKGRRYRVSAASYPERKRPTSGAAGESTLATLERFTINGPRPASRGDAFLYAQGAKTLPAELESEAEKARGEKPFSEERRRQAGMVRTVLLRRNGRTFVVVTDPDAEGKTTRVDIPENLVEGIPGDALIDVEVDGRRVRDVLPVGSARADIVIGRAARKRGVLFLEPLLAERARPSSLYGRLPLSADRVVDGEIVQAFVSRSDHGGFTAKVLLDLGPQLTPEIAVREIALRHGARGYFPKDVIQQVERQAKTQGDGPLPASPRFEDLRALPFVTIDPVGAGDLDDAFYAHQEADGGYTWMLATADVARYVGPGTPAFRNAARIGNTFYSIDKDGVSDYPMNHPIVAKSLSSLLAGKDSYAMITRMRFNAAGELLPDKSGVTLGLVRAQGRYTYDQVADEWRGRAGSGVSHGPMIALARKLSAMLQRSDDERGELKLDFDETARVKKQEGWRAISLEREPLVEESHRLIEELKVYGNRVIAERLTDITRRTGVPHISRVHPKQDVKKEQRAWHDLAKLGVPWLASQTLPEYLASLHARKDVSRAVKQLAQVAALRSRASARYAVVDVEGHDGLALKPGEYDHPSAPIRRFSDMYNRALLEASLEGGDVNAVYGKVLADLRSMGFDGLEDFVSHLNGREQAARQMDYEVDRFMDVFELSQPRNLNRPLHGHVKSTRIESRSGSTIVEIQLREPPVSIEIQDTALSGLKILDEVEVTVLRADPSRGYVHALAKKITDPVGP